MEVTADARHFRVGELLGDRRAELRIGLIVLAHQYEMNGLAADLHLLRVGLLDGETGAVFVVFAEMRDTAGQRTGVADRDGRDLFRRRFRGFGGLLRLFLGTAAVCEDERGANQCVAELVCELLVIVVVGGIGGAVALRAAKKAQDNGKGPPVALQFAPSDLTRVKAMPLARWLPVSGTLQPVHQAIVKARVPGDVREVTVREGETVKAGQLLVRIDTTDLDSKLIDRVGALESARAQLALAEKTRAMNTRLLNDKFISQNAFDNAESSFSVAQGNVKSMEAQLQLA